MKLTGSIKEREWSITSDIHLEKMLETVIENENSN